jgi:thymidylate kinase
MELWWLDRSTTIGQMIDGYLKSNVEMDDCAIHLLFSANRWEAAYVFFSFFFCWDRMSPRV